MLYGPDGKLLKPMNWPDAIVQSVEGIEFQEDGSVKKVKLSSKLAARRLILEQTGKLKSVAGAIEALAAALRHDLEAHGNHGGQS